MVDSTIRTRDIIDFKTRRKISYRVGSRRPKPFNNEPKRPPYGAPMPTFDAEPVEHLHNLCHEFGFSLAFRDIGDKAAEHRWYAELKLQKSEESHRKSDRTIRTAESYGTKKEARKIVAKHGIFWVSVVTNLAVGIADQAFCHEPIEPRYDPVVSVRLAVAQNWLLPVMGKVGYRQEKQVLESYKPSTLFFTNTTGKRFPSTLNPVGPLPAAITDRQLTAQQLRQDFHLFHPILEQAYNVCAIARNFEISGRNQANAYAKTLMLHIHDALHTASITRAESFSRSFIKGALEVVKRRQERETVESIMIRRFQNPINHEIYQLQVEEFHAVILFAARCTFFKDGKSPVLGLAAFEVGRYMVRNLEAFPFWAVKVFVQHLEKVNNDLLAERLEKRQ
ncbi:hypothetical protein N431DRAFT_443695 [Stipitochalara longipes BDJ]|nr:hypothetical protein N431DRAFT_443695 [Stipitochalara longipes BDJ]